MASWIGMISVVQRGPQAQQMAAQVISVVTITHAALTHSAPELRRELLFELVSNEGIRITLLEPTDVVEPPPDTPLMEDIEALVKAKLGRDTRFSRRVNGVPGFYVSFKIDDDKYWLMVDRERIDGLSRAQWVGWAALVGGLSLIVAALLTSLVNLPLARLTAAARDIARGQRPTPLPETGPIEVQEANRSFNQMVDDLARIESDRAVILAGISHDLRTPLARMQLEVEMADLPPEAREGMQSDIAQMDAIIAQFLDYAKPTESSSFAVLDLSALLAEVAQEASRISELRLLVDIDPDLHVKGNPTDLKRVISNLIENARRYGKTPGMDFVEMEIFARLSTTAAGKRVLVTVQDHGSGVPDDQLEQMLRPFTRLDTARGQANGAGLGLAIVNRVITRHEAELHLRNRAGGGLAIDLAFPPAA
ncbi:ATP-binding protein [Massilia sp. TS11]|nr:sensor histidine kinase [Massilia sp. TS11]MCG2583282.1 ATP-binding protein [Massilia sp. TS11]